MKTDKIKQNVCISVSETLNLNCIIDSFSFAKIIIKNLYNLVYQKIINFIYFSSVNCFCIPPTLRVEIKSQFLTAF